MLLCGLRVGRGLIKCLRVTVRTGQAHRTLLGHTAPVTCLQFDENHIISGSLDKSLRVRHLLSPLWFKSL